MNQMFTLGGYGNQSNNLENVLKYYDSTYGDNEYTAFKTHIYRRYPLFQKPDPSQVHQENYKLQQDGGILFNGFHAANPDPNEYLTLNLSNLKKVQIWHNIQNTDVAKMKEALKGFGSTMNNLKKDNYEKEIKKIKELKLKNAQLLEKLMSLESMVEKYSLLTNNFERITNEENYVIKCLSDLDVQVKDMETKLSDARSILENYAIAEQQNNFDEEFEKCDAESQKNIYSIFSKFKYGIERLQQIIKHNEEYVKNIETQESLGTTHADNKYYGNYHNNWQEKELGVLLNKNQSIFFFNFIASNHFSLKVLRAQ